MVKAGLRYCLNVRFQGEIKIKCNPENRDSVRKLYRKIRYLTEVREDMVFRR